MEIQYACWNPIATTIQGLDNNDGLIVNDVNPLKYVNENMLWL